MSNQVVVLVLGKRLINSALRRPSTFARVNCHCVLPQTRNSSYDFSIGYSSKDGCVGLGRHRSGPARSDKVRLESYFLPTANLSRPCFVEDYRFVASRSGISGWDWLEASGATSSVWPGGENWSKLSECRGSEPDPGDLQY